MQEKKKKTLSQSIVKGYLLFVLLLCCVLSSINYSVYERSLYTKYEASIIDILNLVRSQIDVDDLQECMRTGHKSEKFFQLQEFFDLFKDNVDIHYLYVIVPLNTNPVDNVMNVIAGMSTYEKKYMPYNEVMLNELTGDGYSVSSVTKYLNAAKTKEMTFFVSDFVKVAYNVDYTGVLPLYNSNGEYVALLCADKDVSAISTAVMDASILNIVIILVCGIIFIVLFFIWSNYYIAKPIEKLDKAVSSFAYQHKDKGNVDALVIEDPGIHTGNEIESLSHSIVKMSKDMQSYVRHIIETESRARALSEMANTDTLTGIQNKVAFDYFVNSIDERIKSGSTEYSVVIIDLNDLRDINDLYGYDRGNEYIKMSSNVICHVFSHSPVFRIGGDEFAIVLKGEDFDNRLELIDEATDLFNIAEHNSHVDPWEKLSCAIGIADFEKGTDDSIKDVINEADKNMCANKRAMKAARENK